MTESAAFPPLFSDEEMWELNQATPDDAPPEPEAAVEEAGVEAVAWQGLERLRAYVVPISSLVVDAEPGDVDQIVVALGERGQANPVLVADDGVTVVDRAWIVRAAESLGWGGVAVRSRTAELAEREESLDQTSLLQEAELAGVALDGFQREEREIDIDAINEESAAAESEWVALPEFVPASPALRVVISVATEEERKALFDVLAIRTIHKGTRGTLSVWWPDKEREDLSSLRFVDLFKEEKSGD